VGHERGRSLRLDALTGWLHVAGLRLPTGLARRPHKARQPRTQAESAGVSAFARTCVASRLLNSTQRKVSLRQSRSAFHLA
jgi:hypothetical protein